MKLILIRHAAAEGRAAPGQTHCADDSGALGDAGRRQMRKVATKLRRLEKRVDRLACSNSRRAGDTAEVIARVYRRVPLEILEALTPGGRPADVLAWLSTQPADSVVAIVGQEPDLGKLIGFLTCGRPNRAVALKECGVCMLAFDSVPGVAMGMVRWVLTPAQMRSMKI